MIIKWIVIAILIVSAFAASADEYNAPHKVEFSKSKIGTYIRIVNINDYKVYCNITGHNPLYFKEFFIKPHKKSRKYSKPRGEYKVKCK